VRFKTEFGSNPALISKIVDGIDKAISVGFTDMKVNCVYGGPNPENDLDTMLNFTSDRNLTLVLLPELPFGSAHHNKEVSLDDLYLILKNKNIRKEEILTDGEGLRKRLITMQSGARVLLRLDELRGKFPYPACSSCQKISICREGIFPVRLTAKGNLRPCLADGLPEVNMGHIIKTRNEEHLLLAFKQLGSK
jgi:cyclic pyranopterin phosphate synthase